MYPVITKYIQQEFENNCSKREDMGVPCICGVYGRVCRQMNKSDGANRLLCINCSLAEYAKHATVTSKTITDEQKEKVNRYLNYEEGSRFITDYAYAFYLNQINNDLDLGDADRYANLNTILGYDIGIELFRKLDTWLWEHDFDLMELNGSDENKELLQMAVRETQVIELDYSKWTKFDGYYTYSFFEDGVRYE